MIRFIEGSFDVGESLPAKMPDTRISFAGFDVYNGKKEPYTHHRNVKVVLVQSQHGQTLGKMKLFPYILLHLVHAFVCGKNRDIVDNPGAKIKEFLVEEGLDSRFPNLYTYESYYAAMARRIIEKLN